MRYLPAAIALFTITLLVVASAPGDETRDRLILKSKSLKTEIANRNLIERLKQLGLEPEIEPDPQYHGQEMKDLIQQLLDVNLHINGEDERVNVGTIPLQTGRELPVFGCVPITSEVRRNMRGVAAVMLKADMEQVGSSWRPKSIATYSKVQNVCIDKVRFALEPVLANCTAFLVDPQTVATAGHCVKNVQPKKLLFVFDFTADHHVAKVEFPDTDVVAGEELVGALEEPLDLALIRLARKVEGRDPLPIDLKQALSVDDEVYMIGHSSGLPLKIGGCAKILRTATHSFVADVDSLGGNSGSPILSLATHNVVGILARSREGYVDIGGCTILESCPSSLFTDCDGEGCTRSTEIARLQETVALPTTPP